MAGSLTNPRDLFLQLLGEALWIERMLVFEILPQVHREADSERLAEPLELHLEQTRAHVARVEAMFATVGAEVSSAISHSLEGLRRAHDELVPKVVEPRLKDLAIADAAARIEHLEIALYTSLIRIAEQLDIDPKPLERNVADERDALKQVERAAAELRAKLPA
jgi:ferritin-like metal-binding protein YciE